MRRRLIAGFLAFAIVAMVLLEVPLGASLATNARNTALSELQDDGTSLGLLIGSALAQHHVGEAQALASQFSRESSSVVVVVVAGRPIVAAGAGAAEEVGDPSTSALLRLAKKGETTGEEGSSDPDDDLLYVALPLSATAPRHKSGAADAPGSFGAVLLVAQRASPLHSRIAADWIKLAVFGAVVLAVAAAFAAVIANSLARPLAQVEAAVTALGLGHLSERAPSASGPAELRNLAETVNEMASRLEELLHAQRTFVADASHQLRTPMTALRLRLENLETSVAEDDMADLTAAIAEADRLSRVVDGLLSLARADGTRPAREAIDVPGIIHERVEAWAPLAEERGITLLEVLPPSGEAPRDLAAVACPGSLEQVLDNLLSNAIDATPAGGTVTLRAERVGDDVEVHVVDGGPGMSTSDRARAFDRFWRRDGTRWDGTGLGLAIAAQLVRTSGGSTWLDEADGGGIDAVVQLELAERPGAASRTRHGEPLAGSEA